MNTNEQGFSLLELLLAFAISLIIITTFIPMINWIKLEQSILIERVEHYHLLHNFLQNIDPISLPITKKINTKNNEMEVTFTYDQGLIRGMGTWKNAKRQKEQAILYYQAE
ncbi:prepilin-type N-terminal cleavage/methylation domain-containing protein [Amphibacillus sediminis]|uniref:prepilin-type N-terminal cleavage/methylation domain-containing protein n=1 Tax=Amphibacillus sediminis TaxID=360185 RepID=UPI00082F8081|nr:prepilin-type N-terminal cleavage/methylation domain-containing protein [Amphibacillus sediminis]